MKKMLIILMMLQLTSCSKKSERITDLRECTCLNGTSAYIGQNVKGGRDSVCTEIGVETGTICTLK